PRLTQPVEGAPRGRSHGLRRRAGLDALEGLGRLGEGERAERVRGGDGALRAVGQAVAQDGERGRTVLADEPPEGRVQLAGRDRRERAVHGLPGRLAADQGFERRGYHCVRSRSTGWSGDGASLARKWTRLR